MILGHREFNLFRKLILEKIGISLNNGKLELVRARLAKRLRQLNIPTFKEYYYLLSEHPDGPEMLKMLDAITTNQTSFFREAKHFSFLNDAALLLILKKKEQTGDRVFRIWSAGCSTGEEPYSLAIIMLEFLENHPKYETKIFATDISTEVLKAAIKGIYEKRKITDVPLKLLKKYFLRGEKTWGGFYKTNQKLSKIVHFERFNLMENHFSFPSSFDIIFCRNVMIYFDKKTQENLINKYYSVLNQGNYLFIGHSESLMGIKHKFQYVQPTVYVK